MTELTQTHVVEAEAALTDVQKQSRTRRNKAIAWGLVAYVVLIFLVTIARLGGGGLQLDKIAL